MPALDPTQGPMATLVGVFVVVSIVAVSGYAISRLLSRWSSNGWFYPTFHITLIYRLLAVAIARKEGVKSCSFNGDDTTFTIVAYEERFDTERDRGQSEGKLESLPVIVLLAAFAILADTITVAPPTAQVAVLLVFAGLLLTASDPPEVAIQTEVVPRVAD